MPPTVDQVEFSPFQFRRALLAACEASGVVLEAYSPLTRGHDLGHRVIGRDRAAARADAGPGAAALGGAAGDPGHPEVREPGPHRENAAIFDFALPAADMAALDGLDRTGGTAEA